MKIADVNLNTDNGIGMGVTRLGLARMSDSGMIKTRQNSIECG
jgi:hypothetical protein